MKFTITKKFNHATNIDFANIHVAQTGDFETSNSALVSFVKDIDGEHVSITCNGYDFDKLAVEETIKFLTALKDTLK